MSDNRYYTHEGVVTKCFERQFYGFIDHNVFFHFRNICDADGKKLDKDAVQALVIVPMFTDRGAVNSANPTRFRYRRRMTGKGYTAVTLQLVE